MKSSSTLQNKTIIKDSVKSCKKLKKLQVKQNQVANLHDSNIVNQTYKSSSKISRVNNSLRKQPNKKDSLFQPLRNNPILKLKLQKQFQDRNKKQLTEYKIKCSPQYKRLLFELERLKKAYLKQFNGLNQQLKDLDEKIAGQGQTLIVLINKNNRITSDLDRYHNDLIQLQQRNYQFYWDVALITNNESQNYEELLELQEQIGNVSKGFSKEDLGKLIKKYQKIKIPRYYPKIQQQNPEEVQSSELCCICCQNILLNQKICYLPCGHQHHTECIKKWFTINKACPLCRIEVQI